LINASPCAHCSPRKLVLQHLLVDEKSKHVTKHWRQDWIYEAPQRFEFSADQTWTVHALPPCARPPPHPATTTLPT